MTNQFFDKLIVITFSN